MPSGFSFLREYQVGKETVWEYSCSFSFNRQEIEAITITDYWLTKPDEKKLLKN
ncbi:MAG: hypothetical protein MRERV_20c017 [Mycoplasmataceae bacterium RV_VA103A]|nr:MAG: hypothetical protein MRERV_20c017 [Mycoplasmataceae bacterium RV_VA103A]